MKQTGLVRGLCPCCNSYAIDRGYC